MIKVLSALVLGALLTSCTQINLEDVSGNEAYSDLIGQEYESVVALLIHGITTDPNYGEEVDLFTVTEKPGIGGPEVLSQELLEIGTVIKIDKALACTNCLGQRIQFEVEILSEEEYRDHPVMIIDRQIMNFVTYSNGRAEVNPDFFVKVAH